MFKEYKTLSAVAPDYVARLALLRALVALHLATPSELRVVGAI